MNPRDLLLESFRAAVAAADPALILPPHLPVPPHGRTLVVGGGKAAASMAAAVEAHWPADAALSGLVVTRYQHSLPTRRIEVVEASHPLPDGRGEDAARRMLDMASQLGPDDLLLALISGGGSSLLAAPVEGVTLKELRQVTKALLNAGATIHDINTVRKHLTRLSGGRLAQAANRAQGLALIISDVVGDDPTHIASGPCAPDPTTCADAIERLQRFRIALPAGIKRHLEACAAEGSLPSGAAPTGMPPVVGADRAPHHRGTTTALGLVGSPGRQADTPKPGDPCFARMENRVIANARGSLQAAGLRLREPRLVADAGDRCAPGVERAASPPNSGSRACSCSRPRSPADARRPRRRLLPQRRLPSCPTARSRLPQEARPSHRRPAPPSPRPPSLPPRPAPPSPARAGRP
jgi:hydroxypyruvate reductase